MTVDLEKRDKIRFANDAFRATGAGGRIIVRGALAHPDGRELARKVVGAVMEFTDFDESNDPHHEHDFGKVEVDGHSCFFKIDYYADETLSYGSEDPSDLNKTHRVMTIFFVEDY